VSLIDLFLHLDKHLLELIEYCGPWTYVVLFLIIFCETGLVVAPFLPGDSLLFVSGTFAATGVLKIEWLCVVFLVAAVAGDAVNYTIGSTIGQRLLNKQSRFLKPKHIERTQHFYQRYGGKTIVLARFVPFVRTFAPFLAGVGKMAYPRFAKYNVLGALIWVGLAALGGYWFGNLPFVRDNFSLVIILLVVVSVIPAAVEFIRHRLHPASR
jgi:membrane-associated protein